VAGYVNVWQLYRSLRRDGVYQPGAGWRRLTVQMVIANGVMAVLLLFAVPGLEQWAVWGATQRALHLALWVTAAIAAYVLSLRLAGVDLPELLGRRSRS
jgi:putative peptidoglycan lipid II flippase